MGGGKGGGGSTAPVYQGEPRANADYFSRYPDVAAGWEGDPYGHYIQHGQFEGRTYGVQPEGISFEMPDFGAFGGFDQAAFDAEQQRMQQEQIRMQDLANLDTLWGSRMDAADRAISDVVGQIDREESNARQSGLDYEITDEQRQQRVNNMFASYWTGEDENRLGGLTKKYGNPEQDSGLRGQIELKGGYNWEYDVIRGDEPTPIDNVSEGAGQISSKKSGPLPTAVTPASKIFAEEDTVLGA